MLEDRWSYFESHLAPGEKCEERLAHEQETRIKAEKEAEEKKKKAQDREERKRRLQQVTWLLGRTQWKGVYVGEEDQH